MAGGNGSATVQNYNGVSKDTSIPWQYIPDVSGEVSKLHAIRLCQGIQFWPNPEVNQAWILKKSNDRIRFVLEWSFQLYHEEGQDWAQKSLQGANWNRQEGAGEAGWIKKGVGTNWPWGPSFPGSHWSVILFLSYNPGWRMEVDSESLTLSSAVLQLLPRRLRNHSAGFTNC